MTTLQTPSDLPGPIVGRESGRGRSAPIQSVNWKCRIVKMKSMIIGIQGLTQYLVAIMVEWDSV